MKVEIFDVEHGGCALITAVSGARMLIDCGYNSSTGWRPSLHLAKTGVKAVDFFVVANYDDDHVNDLPNLRRGSGGRQIRLRSLLRNKTVSSQALVRMKTDGGMGPGIRELLAMIKVYTGGPLKVDWGSLSFSVFYNSYPGDFNDTNNLSLVIFLHCHNMHLVFPGDLEKAGWEKLLGNPEFVKELKTVNIFVASHHGRESGCCEGVFEISGVKTCVVIFSDAGMQYESQRTADWYRHRTSGMNYNGMKRHVFTTRRDGKITIEATSRQTTISTAR